MIVPFWVQGVSHEGVGFGNDAMGAPVSVVDIEQGGLLAAAGDEPIALVLNETHYWSQSDCIIGPVRFLFQR